MYCMCNYRVVVTNCFRDATDQEHPDEVKATTIDLRASQNLKRSIHYSSERALFITVMPSSAILSFLIKLFISSFKKT